MSHFLVWRIWSKAEPVANAYRRSKNLSHTTS